MNKTIRIISICFFSIFQVINPQIMYKFNVICMYINNIIKVNFVVLLTFISNFFQIIDELESEIKFTDYGPFEEQISKIFLILDLLS